MCVTTYVDTNDENNNKRTSEAGATFNYIMHQMQMAPNALWYIVTSTVFNCHDVTSYIRIRIMYLSLTFLNLALIFIIFFRKALQELLDDGSIYNTVDYDHFKIADDKVVRITADDKGANFAAC